MSKLICPKCNKKIEVMCLTSNPPQYECGCSCGFSLRFYERTDSFKHITQEELNNKTTQLVSLEDKEPTIQDIGKTVYSPQWWGDYKIVSVGNSGFRGVNNDGEEKPWDKNEYDDFYWQRPILISEQELKDKDKKIEELQAEVEKLKDELQARGNTLFRSVLNYCEKEVDRAPSYLELQSQLTTAEERIKELQDKDNLYKFLNQSIQDKRETIASMGEAIKELQEREKEAGEIIGYIYKLIKGYNDNDGEGFGMHHYNCNGCPIKCTDPEREPCWEGYLLDKAEQWLNKEDSEL